MKVGATFTKEQDTNNGVQGKTRKINASSGEVVKNVINCSGPVKVGFESPYPLKLGEDKMTLRDLIPVLGQIKDNIHREGGYLTNLYISGSDLYGWRSEDSDVDLRGIFFLDKRRLLGLKRPKDVIEINGIEDHDITIYEIKKVANLLIKGNCNFWEEFNATQTYQTATYKQFKELLGDSWGKAGIYNSYRGTAYQNYKKFIMNGRNTMKKYLYVFRALMAGTYALSHGEIQPNSEILAKYYREKDVLKLIKLKRKGLENEPIHTLEDGSLDTLIDKWFNKIDDAYINSAIPENMSQDDIQRVENFIIEKRLELSNYG